MLEPGARYDIVFDFADYDHKRIIMKNVAGDDPFGGDVDLAGPSRTEEFLYMDRVMAFDVVQHLDEHVPDNFDPHKIHFPIELPHKDNTRRVALFEGTDEFGRLQPLLGTVDKAVDAKGKPITWPEKKPWQEAGLAGKQMQGTMAWHEPTTEIVQIGDTEYWEIWNLSAGKFSVLVMPISRTYNTYTHHHHLSLSL